MLNLAETVTPLSMPVMRASFTRRGLGVGGNDGQIQSANSLTFQLNSARTFIHTHTHMHVPADTTNKTTSMQNAASHIAIFFSCSLILHCNISIVVPTQ